MARNRLLIATSAWLAPLVLGGCGGSNSAGSPSTLPTVAITPTATPTAAEVAAAKVALRNTFLAEVSAGRMPIPLDTASAQCVADAMVDHLGLTQVQHLGLIHSRRGTVRMNSDDAVFTATQLVDCPVNDGAVTAFRERVDAGMSAAVTDAQKTCLATALTRRTIIDLLAAEFDGQAAAGTAAFKATVTAAAHRCGLR